MEALLYPGQQYGVFNSNNTQPPTETRVMELFSLKGKTAIVTGAADGIGFSIVEAFAEAGANVAFWYNSNTEAIDKATKVANSYNVECKAYKVDISIEEEVIKTIEQNIRDMNGRLDVFVANAAVPWLGGRILDSKTEDFTKMLNVNYVSTYYAAKAAGQHFRRQKLEGIDIFGKPLENYATGSFIVTSSGSTLRGPLPQAMTPYSAAKSATEQFVRGLAIEWATFARVNSVCPGYITTKMLDKVPDELRKIWAGQTPMGREGSVAECKGLYLYLASDASSYCTGANMVLDGGYTLL
ncbi:Sorbose reductase sou1 [Orbilia ellipsospora]|uniref:Sorbose reductase sou1 n=1 Tax=Orbilia ellipsospora TaxID=2528407 RepID=A0AAV9X9A1_9PEZI